MCECLLCVCSFERKFLLFLIFLHEGDRISVAFKSYNYLAEDRISAGKRK